MNNKIIKTMGGVVGACVAGILLVLGATMVAYPAISQIAGLAVAQSSTLWNNVRDAVVGDGISNGIMAESIYLFNGSTFDRVRGDSTNGMDVDVTRMPATVGVQPVQGTTLLNSNNVSAANTALTVTLTGAASQRVHLYKISTATCSPDGTSQLTIQDGGVTIWNTLQNSVGPALNQYEALWPVGLTGGTGNSVTVQIGACGVGNVGVLNIQADRF